MNTFALDTYATTAWLDDLEDRQNDPERGTSPFPSITNVDITQFDWTRQADLLAFDDLVISAQDTDAITGPYPLWCQTRIDPADGEPVVRVGIALTATTSITTTQELTFQASENSANVPGRTLLLFTLAEVINEINRLWDDHHAPDSSIQRRPHLQIVT